MEIQASRLRRAGRRRRRAGPAARPGPGALGPAARSAAGWRRWSAPSGSAARSARTRCRPRSPPATPAPRVAEDTDWARIAALYDALAAARRPRRSSSSTGRWPSAMAYGPAGGARRCVDALVDEPALRGYHLLPSVRGDLLARLGRARGGPRRVRARGGADRQPAAGPASAPPRRRLLDRSTATSAGDRGYWKVGAAGDEASLSWSRWSRSWSRPASGRPTMPAA